MILEVVTEVNDNNKRFTCFRTRCAQTVLCGVTQAFLLNADTARKESAPFAPSTKGLTRNAVGILHGTMVVSLMLLPTLISRKGPK